jgi:hypothetical protein
MQISLKQAFSALTLAALFTVIPASAQYGGYSHGDPSWSANQTIADLKAVSAHNTYNPHEMERYDSAMTHLSQFAEKLHQGRFDRGKLDHGIGDVQNILNKNPMDGRARDILNRDLGELRRLRATYRIPY